MARGYRQECKDLLKKGELGSHIEVLVKFAPDQVTYEYLFFDDAADNPNAVIGRSHSGKEALAFTQGLITGRLLGLDKARQTLRGLT